jgi:hypothetical protein
MYYETHITVSTANAKEATEIAKIAGWKTSEIARDPLLGEDTFFYLTRHSKNYNKTVLELENCIKFLKEYEIPILREKIEYVIYDTKKKLIK